MTKTQLELHLNRSPEARPIFRRQRRLRRAHWWFQQMRHVVNQALDRGPAPLPRPEQIYLTLARHSVGCGSGHSVLPCVSPAVD